MARLSEFGEPSDLVLAAMERPGKLDRVSALLGLPVGRLLGCGSVGCAWELGVDAVVKITSDELEMRLWQWLYSKQDAAGAALEAIPAIFRVAWLQLDPELALGMVAREKLEPIRDPWKITPLVRLGFRYTAAAHDFYMKQDEERAMERMRRASDEIALTPRAAHLGRTLWWLARRGHPATDIHESNLGIRTDPRFGDVGEIVLLDPGPVPGSSGEDILERLLANPCCDQLTANAETYYVWTVKPRGTNPVEGWGPYTNLGNTKIHARIKAQKGKHDVTVTTDPRKPGFRVVRRYQRGTGETLVRG